MPRPWLEEQADISAYFNYQMNEHSFLQFINRQIRIQLQKDRDVMLHGTSSVQSLTKGGSSLHLPVHSSGGGHAGGTNHQFSGNAGANTN